jgi:hypothetical protein
LKQDLLAGRDIKFKSSGIMTEEKKIGDVTGCFIALNNLFKQTAKIITAYPRNAV